MAEKLDWKKDLKHLYAPSAKAPEMVDVPPMNYLMIDGHGDPNTSPAYQAAVEGLFSMSYTLKFAIKKAVGLDYAVFPAEGLWWVEDMRLFSIEDKGSWDWTMMVAQPEVVTADWVEQARAEVLKKKGLPVVEQIRFECLAEGPAAQIITLALMLTKVQPSHACMSLSNLRDTSSPASITRSTFRMSGAPHPKSSKPSFASRSAAGSGAFTLPALRLIMKA